MGEEQHCACFENCASCHIDKIFVNKHAHRIFSSSILCVMTFIDNTIDAVVMYIGIIICQQVNP